MSDSDLEGDLIKESGYCTEFEDFIMSEMPAPEKENCLTDISDDDDDFQNAQLLNANLDEEAHNFIDGPSTCNIFYPDLDSVERSLFKQDGASSFKKVLRNSLERHLYQENRMDFLVPVENEPSASIRSTRSGSVDIFEDCSEDEMQCNDFREDAQMSQPQNALEPIVSIEEESTRARQDIISDIENFLLQMLKDLVEGGDATIRIINSTKWENCEMTNGKLSLKEPSSLMYRSVKLNSLKSRYRFAMIMYILSEVYHLLITGTTCTERELYYNDPELTESQLNVNAAVKDVCSILNASPWDLGIRSSSKGLIAGAIKIHLSNNVLIDCYMCDRATLIPADMQDVTLLEATAKFVLIIEKHTIFEKLLKRNILLNLNSDVILITGKGYPDLSTRLMIKRIWNDFHLPIYALVDADPFGIEIMLVYRFGSRAMAMNSDHLSCPQIRWIGIQPSEIEMLAIPSVPQSKEDKKKIIELLQRSYVSNEIRIELELLQRLNRKAEIEGVASFSANFLVSDYIPNKIKRNLVI